METIDRLKAQLEEVNRALELSGKVNRKFLEQAQADIKEIAALKDEIERLQMICACAYQMAGVAGAPVRFLDALSCPLEMTREQIDALLPVRDDEFEIM
jgi:hypothetical protein